METKQKILSGSIALFNEFGIANVRLQQIADEIGISVGNLAYHYKNKEAIVEAICLNLQDELREILSTYRLFPNLIDLDHQLSKYYEFVSSYPFFFNDLLEIKRLCPIVHQGISNDVCKMVSQFKRRLEFNSVRGVMKDEMIEGQFDSLARTLWSQVSFWHLHHSSSDQDSPARLEEFKMVVWSILFPMFSEKGRMEFEQLIVPILEST